MTIKLKGNQELVSVINYIDVGGNSEDGCEVNDQRRSDEIININTLRHGDPSDIIAWLISKDYLTDSSNTYKNLSVNDSVGGLIEVTDISTGCPLLGIEYEA